MATIQSAIELQDNFSTVLYGVVNAINLTISTMEEMSYAMDTDMNVDTSSLQYAREEIARATANLDSMVSSVEEVEQPVQRVQRGFSGWQRAIIVANQAAGLIQNTLGRVGVMDTSGAFDRIDTMNRFQKTVTLMTRDTQMADVALEQLNGTVTGTAYGLDVAAKSAQGFYTRGMELGTATDQVRIWADAVSFYGEGTNEQMESVVDAIGKMYSKGKVEADQLDRLFDAGIGAAEIYADAVNQSVNKVKQELSDGDISSAKFIQTVSEALDSGVSHGAAQDAGGTWATTFANMQAAFTRGWVSVIQSIDSALASHGLPSSMEMVTMSGQKVEGVLNSVGDAMGVVVGVAANIGGFLGSAGSFIVDNWSLIAPVIGGVSAALLLYIGYLAAVKTAEVIGTGVKIAYCIASYAHAAATGGVATATAQATAAQYGLNTALLACPVTWVLIGFIAIVGILGIVIGAYNKLNNAHVSTIGAICGTLNIAIQFLVEFDKAVINVFMAIWNSVSAVVQNIGTAFYNLGCDLKSIWYGILGTITNVIVKVCEAINNLPFVDIDTRGLESAASHYAAEEYAANEARLDYKDVGDAFGAGIDTYQLEDVFSGDFVLDAYNQGYQFGEGLKNKVTDAFDLSGVFNNSAIDDAKNLGKGLENAGLTSGMENIEKNTDAISKSLDITSENIKYIRDFAVARAVNRYTSTNIRVDMTNNNQINGDQDIDGIVNKLGAKLEEKMYSSAEGAH